jgi:ADP-ribose pyrophosphatase YjhB (NUDIX family)
MHRSVAAVIRKDGKILMIDRVNPPFGWACSAGHIEEGEDPEKALIREVKEEVGIEVEKYKLIHHEFIKWNICKHGVRGHDFFVYEVMKWKGDIKNNFESKEIKWISRGELGKIQLEEVWDYFLNKLDLFEKL